MVNKTILSKNQQRLLDLISKDSSICNFFYLTGGTALAEYYLHHRLSEDLDFFSEQEFDSQMVYIFWKKLQNYAGIKKIDFQKVFNRNLFFLYLKDGDIVKTEFTYFPFPRIEENKKIDKLAIDSLLDIAVNKVFTIYQKPRSRDFIDLYLILQENEWSIESLLKKAQIKFDWHVDILQLGAQFLQVKEVKDYPQMIKKIKQSDLEKFFLNEAKNFKNKVLE
ncbi:MAG: nucleotidyl transferase AbiEii/AbiGii toxin family protein [Candidatus Magasanikbacteria bacterium]